MTELFNVATKKRRILAVQTGVLLFFPHFLFAAALNVDDFIIAREELTNQIASCTLSPGSASSYNQPKSTTETDFLLTKETESLNVDDVMMTKRGVRKRERERERERERSNFFNATLSPLTEVAEFVSCF